MWQNSVFTTAYAQLATDGSDPIAVSPQPSSPFAAETFSSGDLNTYISMFLAVNAAGNTPTFLGELATMLGADNTVI